MVFQSYALFPHLNVAENVAFGLRMRRVPRGERGAAVKEALDLVKLGALADRYPRQLSGGQQQRVALARAIVVKPAVLLLDEPLGALDKMLREEMQVELRDLQQRLGITAVFVTHDQEEALTLVRPGGGDARRRDRADRRAARDLRPAGERVRRRIPGRQQFPRRQRDRARGCESRVVETAGGRVRVVARDDGAGRRQGAPRRATRARAHERSRRRRAVARRCAASSIADR